MRAVEGAGVTRLPATTVIGEHQVVTVRLPRPVRDAYTLTIRTETVLDVGATALEAPEVLPVGVDREQGVVAIRGSRERRLEPHLTDGLAQLPLRALPATLQQATGWGRGEPRPPAAFRYLRRPWSLTLRTAEVEPRVSGQVNTLAVVRDDEIGLATTVRYTIRDRGIFGLRLRVPPGFRLQEVANERDVEEARIEEDARGRVLVVDLERRIPEGTFVLGLFGSVPGRRPASRSRSRRSPWRASSVKRASWPWPPSSSWRWLRPAPAG